MDGGFIRSLSLLPERVSSFAAYPYSIPAVAKLGLLRLHAQVTFFVGDNGSGKSTLIEGIAEAAGFNAEGGSKNYNFATREYKAALSSALQLARGMRREKDGFFLRAESLFNVATEIDRSEAEKPGMLRYYGGKSLHEQSHGESFLALVANRFAGEGLYVLDEPEAALSPNRQLALLALIDKLARKEASQLIIATHSPILMAYPEAVIYQLDADGIAPIAYEETEHYQVTRSFLAARESYFKRLFG
jgi:predicted ATPase